MDKITLDTNIIVSAYVSQDDYSSHVMDLIPDYFQWYISPFIREECMHVLSRSYFSNELKNKGKTIDDILLDIDHKSFIVYPTTKIDIVKADPSDNHIIECAYDSGSSYLVSRDRHLYTLKQYGHILIVHPKEFLDYFLKTNTNL